MQIHAPLQLQYTCTTAEREEAQSLGLRQELGRGSKWITRLVLVAMLIVALGLFYLMIQYGVSAPYRPWVLVGTFVLFVFFMVRNRRLLRGAARTASTRVEVSETGVAVAAGNAKASSPWSAFSACLESPNLFVLVDRPKTALLIFPKRAFPDESSRVWFRSLAGSRPAASSSSMMPETGVAPSPDDIVLRFRLGFRDYIDRTVASARSWAAVLCLAAVLLGLTIYATAHPPPHPVYSGAQVYFFFVVPATFLAAGGMILMLAFNAWLSHKGHLIPQETVLSKASIGFVSADGTSEIPWTTYVCYKETRRSFITWNPKGGAWMLIPKRAFASEDELRCCRDLLARNLRPSRWFFG